MKNIILILGFLCVSSSLVAQDAANEEKKEEKKPSNWKINGSSNLRLTQSSYSNWSAGGENSVSGIADGNLNLSFKKEKLSWQNNLVLAYGIAYQGSKRSKTNDKIDFLSKLGYKAFGKVDYTVQVTFISQFDKGYTQYPVENEDLYNSRFMAPAYSVLSVGFDYKPNDDLSLVLSPASGKFTFVTDDSLSHIGAYGVKPDRHCYYELGTYIKFTYNKKLTENISVKTNFDAFSNLLRNPENIDLDWFVSIDFKISKYISSNLNFQLKYDDDVKNIQPDKGPAVQFKQVLSIGFSYNF